jgi:hypothetical protein
LQITLRAGQDIWESIVRIAVVVFVWESVGEERKVVLAAG